MSIARTVALVKYVIAAIVLAAIVQAPGGSVTAASLSSSGKIGPLASARANAIGRSRVILSTPSAAAAAAVASDVPNQGGRVLRKLSLLNAVVVDLPNAQIATFASDPLVDRVSLDRVVVGAMERTGAATGATAVRQDLGFDGSGVAVAVIDSGAFASHDDLAAPGKGRRIIDFVDFVGGNAAAYDDYGHGTHVAGIIAGNGEDSGGARTGIAPGSDLVVLKVLDSAGRGRISDVIAALEYVVANKDALNIRVVNLSVATGVYESYDTDPLTLAARRAVEAGVVVVAAAGNNGRGPTGTVQYGGITAPGNAPWVLTVGASSHAGTVSRADDTVAAFSSRGPSAIDYSAKPDLVAPGVGIESLSDPLGSMYASATSLLPGTVTTTFLPYLSLSGTSMAAPVVSGTVALMLEANPALTPNAVKAILQYTAESYPGVDRLTQGAGFLNAKGAVELARYLASPSTNAYPATAGWSQKLIWGNHVLHGGWLTADANAWSLGVTWGAGVTPAGGRVQWGVTCPVSGCDGTSFEPWQTSCLDARCTTLSADAASPANAVWGSLCGGVNCSVPWTLSIVSGVSDGEGETVVWGTSDGEGDTVVWGTSDTEAETVVWGTSCSDPSCQPVVWNRQ